MSTRMSGKGWRRVGGICVAVWLVIASLGGCAGKDGVTASPAQTSTATTRPGGPSGSAGPASAVSPSPSACTEVNAIKLCADVLRHYGSVAGAIPREGKQYLGVQVSLSSRSRDIAYAFPNRMSLVDSKGTTYQLLNTSILLDDSLLPATLLAGDRVTGMIAFEVPVTVTLGQLRVKTMTSEPPIELDLSLLAAQGQPSAAAPSS